MVSEDLDPTKNDAFKEAMVLNLNFQHVIDYHMFVIDYQQRNFGNSNSKVTTVQEK